MARDIQIKSQSIQQINISIYRWLYQIRAFVPKLDTSRYLQRLLSICPSHIKPINIKIFETGLYSKISYVKIVSPSFDQRKHLFPVQKLLSVCPHHLSTATAIRCKIFLIYAGTVGFEKSTTDISGDEVESRILCGSSSH